MSNNLIVNRQLKRVQQTQNKHANKSTNKKKTDGKSFKNILKENINNNTEVKFSKHAKSRLASRNIQLSNQELDQLTTGVKKAEDKGANDSLIMVNNVAYVVSVKNKTVITAVDDGNMSEKVFTNIDSAVFMD